LAGCPAIAGASATLQRILEKLNIEIIFSQSPLSILLHGKEVVKFGGRVPSFDLPSESTFCFLRTAACLDPPKIALRRHAFIGLQYVFFHGCSFQRKWLPPRKITERYKVLGELDRTIPREQNVSLLVWSE
jgi:hypothetical protein